MTEATNQSFGNSNEILPTFRLMESSPKSTHSSNGPESPLITQQQQIDSLLKLSVKQQASIQQLVELVEQLVSRSPSPINEGPFEWLSHTRYTTIYPRIVSALTTGQPKQRTLTTLLDISPGGSVDWTKASRDWDRLKVILGS